jgi:hypothetical protein
MAKTRLVAIIVACLFATSGWSETTSPSLVATAPQPKWSDLTVQQKIVLAPLADDWDSLEYYRQKKWLGIVARFPVMAPEEQRRIQGQMQEWGKLTSEQRQMARENFKAANQLPAEKKQELKQKWEEYSSLPEDEKEKLKQQAASSPAPKPVRPTLVPSPLPAPALLASPMILPPLPPSPQLTTPPPPPAPAAAPPVDAAPASPAVENTIKP